jgi:CheY-like chemotaxis protein
LKINVDRDVVEAYNGKQAVLKYVQLHKQYNNKCPVQLILMDCDMPIMNGFRATEFILNYAKKEIKKLSS